MPVFDRNQADSIFDVINSRYPVGGLLATQFGVPTCLFNLSMDALSLLPNNTLQGMNKTLESGIQQGQDFVKNKKRQIFIDLGILEVGTDQGNVTLVSTNQGIEQIAGGIGFLEGLNSLGQMMGAAQAVWGEVVEPILDKIEEIKNCLDVLKATKNLQKPFSSLCRDYRPGDIAAVGSSQLAGECVDVDYTVKYAQEREDLLEAFKFLIKSQTIRNNVNTLLDQRFDNPGLEPCFNGDTVITQDNGAEIALKYLTSGTDFCVLDTAALIAQGRLPQEDFRIMPETLDPPLSKQGKFILTETGVYYDTVGGGIAIPENMEELVQCSTIVPETALHWMFEYDPNCGGKGESVTLKQFNEWANTIFDLETPSPIEKDSQIQQYYDNDTFLQQIYGERNRQIYDLSSYIGDLITSGYSSDSALVSNQRQQLQATNARYESRLKRRQKQIQVGVVFGGFDVGEIPINDFSFLDKNNITVPVESQTRLVFNPGEVSSVVLPIDTTLSIMRENKAGEVYLNHLLVPEIGRGAIVSEASSVSAVDHPAVLSLTDNITTEGLIACYNFLNGAVEYEPDSSKFMVTNSADKNDVQYNAQIVASSFDSVFPSGVGIANFEGVCGFFSGTSGTGGNSKAASFESSAQYLQAPYRPLSYMRLPNGVDDFDSLLYRNTGFTFETWVHMPTLMKQGSDGWDNSVGASSLHRVILGNENRGGNLPVPDVEKLTLNRDLNSVGSLLMGFTRDRRFTKDLDPSNDPADNPIDEDLKFYMAPAQSVNTSAITFLPRGSLDCDFITQTGQKYLGAVLDVTSVAAGSTESLGDCSSSFKLLTVTADPKDNGVVTIYCNGVTMKSQGFVDTFGFKGPPNLPTAVDGSSYVYTNTYRASLPEIPWTANPGTVYQKDFWHWYGPEVGAYTPWIVGGGYTDGMTNIDFGYGPGSIEGMNFLGGQAGGRRSGLNGMLGSVKLYNRALTSTEVTKNYNAQKGFFENIEV